MQIKILEVMKTMKFWNWIKNEEGERTLYFDGYIAEDSWFDDDITPKKFKAELMESYGGYLVPTEYDTRLIEGLNEENIMRKLSTIIKTGAERKINIAASTHAAAWIDEGGQLTFGDVTFDQINLDAHKLHVAVKVTEELLYDNVFNLENYILDKFAKALANSEEDAFLNGDGVGKPTGIFNETDGGEIGVTTAGATAITANEIINLIYSL